MIKAIFTIFLAVFAFGAQKINELNLAYDVTNINLKGENLLISTDGGKFYIYNVKDGNFTTQISLPNVKTYYDDAQKAKIFNADEINRKILILSQGDFGKKQLFILQRGVLSSLNLKSESIKKALFIDENTVVLASIGNEISFLDLDKNEITFSYKFSTSSLSDIELNTDRSYIVAGCESGIIYLFDIKMKKVITSFDVHKDNIYDVAIADNDTIVSASADRNMAIIAQNQTKLIPSKFLVYAAGISADGKFAAFMSSEDSDVTIINTNSQRKLTTLKTKQSTINGLIFVSDDTLISSAYEKKIYFWRF